MLITGFSESFCCYWSDHWKQ